MDKIAIIGPFPNPIHGMSLANKNLLEFYESKDEVSVSCFDITIGKKIKAKNNQGKFKSKNIFCGVINSFLGMFFVLKNIGARFYITPPQSALGYLRMLPIFILASALGRRVIVHIHGAKFADNISNSNFLLKNVVGFSFCFIDKILLLGESIVFRHLDMIPRGKIEICANGVCIPKNIKNKEVGSKKLNILFLSNLMKDKGIFDFLDAISKLDENQYSVNIAGEIEIDNEAEILHLLSKNSNIITFHGVVSGSAKDKLFRNADVFILPSYDEGQPLSILEAYSYGCAVITTCVGGIPDIFQNGINGEYSRINDSGSILTALDKIVHNGISKYSLNNRSVSISGYSIDRFCKAVDGFLRF